MDNKEISDIFEVIAQMLGLDPRPTTGFEVRAYQKAALTIATLQRGLDEIYEQHGIKGLMELPGIGEGLARKIEEYIKTGKIRKYEELKKRYPIDFKTITKIEGMGAKKAFALYRELGVKNIEDLKKAAKQHKIRALGGFGEKSENTILSGLELIDKSKGRMLLGEGLPVAERIVSQLEGSGLAEKVMIAGSARRMRETVGDIDILVLSSRADEVMDRFTTLPEVSDIIAKGPTKSTVMLNIGIPCDIRVIAPESFGAAIQYFTGSKDHNVQVRTIAIGKKYKLNEYGLFGRNKKIMPTKDEEGIYAKLDMQWMPPEMREARGEVKLAQAHNIPKIIELDDIKGDMHTHTVETDGYNTIEEMAAAATGLGREYIATTNHTKSLQIAKGMNERQFGAYFRKVDSLNKKHEERIRIIKGAEVDILKDGTLDLARESLESMECVVAAVHSNMKMEKKAMTGRIVKALDSGLVHILAHPTGREVLGRPAYEMDIEKVLEAAERNGVALEINSQPNRLDLSDTNIMTASKYRVMFSIDTDAHSAQSLTLMRYGIGMARRGWLTKERVINTFDAKRILGWLAGRR
jgi:DNA polymerase (family 10)